MIDGIAHLEPKMKEIFGDAVKFKRLEARKKGLISRFGVEGGLSSPEAMQTLAQAVVDHGGAKLEERAAWARLGL